MGEWLNLAMYMFFSAAIGAAISFWLLTKRHAQESFAEIERATTLARSQGVQEGQALKAQQLPEEAKRLAATQARLEVLAEH